MAGMSQYKDSLYENLYKELSMLYILWHINIICNLSGQDPYMTIFT